MLFSGSGSGVNNGEVANAVPVQISQTVTGVETKAAIIPGNKMDAVIIMVDGNSSSASAPDFDSFVPKKDKQLAIIRANAAILTKLFFICFTCIN